MNTFKNNNNTMKARDLKLTNGVLFKFVFGREERKNLTISFLNDLLHAELNHEIEDLKFEPTEQIGLFKNDKQSQLDIVCTLKSGEIVDIEIQLADEGNYKKRSLYYWACLYSSSLKAASNYKALVPCICINILNFTLFEKKAHPFTTIILDDPETHERFLKDLSMIYIELPKFKKKPKAEMSKIERWIALLNDKVSYEEKEEYAMNDQAMTDVLKAYDQFFSDPAVRHMYLRREMARMDYEVAMENREERTRQECALAFIKKGLPKDMVFETLKMSDQESSDFLNKYKGEI